MPVEIKELVIKAVINEAQSAGSGGNDRAGGVGKDRKMIVNDPDVLVEACVKQVLKILKRKQER